MHVGTLMRHLTATIALASLLFAAASVRAQEARPPRQGPRYKVRIDSAPQQAAIYLDDVKYGIVGYTPWTGELEAGEWKVILKRDDYEDGHRAMTVNRSDSIQETFIPMVRAEEPASLDVRSDADANARGAELWVSGELKGKVPMSLRLADGRYLVEIKRSGYEPFSQWVTVKKGERVTLNPVLVAVAPVGPATGSVHVSSNVEGAQVYLDGTNVGAVPREITDIAVGEHTVEVRAEGYASRSESLSVAAGSSTRLVLDLSPAEAPRGTLKVQSPVDGAEVFIDGRKVGTAPQVLQVAAGDHRVRVTKDGLAAHEEVVAVTAGRMRTVTATLEEETGGPGASVDVDADLEASEDDVEASDEPETETDGATAFSARALPRGTSTIDFATGFPYYLHGGVTIGAGGEGTIGYDLGVLIRSYFTRSDLAVKGRVTLVDQEPFSIGLFGDLGIGAALFSRSQRRGVFGDLGAAASISGLGSVTLTFRGYLSWWRDRHCPGLTDMGGFPSSSDPIEECDDYLSGRLSPEERQRIDDLLGGPDMLFEPDWGARFMTSFIAEVAIRKNWNFYFLFEGAPFQGERAAFVDAFYAPMFDTDPATYFRLGFTHEF